MAKERISFHNCFFTLIILQHIVLVSSFPDDECPDAFPAHENCEFDEVCEDASCQYNEYVTCHLNRCGTCEAVFRGYDNLTVNCKQLTPKCRLMHLEMLHKSKSGQSRPGRGRLDVDNIYDPECEANGTFKAKQCDDDSNLCWCVDSAGVRVTDKMGDDPKCDGLVQVHLIQIDFSFKADFMLLNGKEEELQRYLVAKVISRFPLKTPQILEIAVHKLTQGVTIKLCKNGTKEPVDIATVAYYIERDLKRNRLLVSLDGRDLEVDMESIQVLFFDNEPPRINMKTISPGFAAIIIVIALAVLTGIAMFVVIRRRAEQEHSQFEVVEVRFDYKSRSQFTTAAREGISPKLTANPRDAADDPLWSFQALRTPVVKQTDSHEMAKHKGPAEEPLSFPKRPEKVPYRTVPGVQTSRPNSHKEHHLDSKILQGHRSQYFKRQTHQDG